MCSLCSVVENITTTEITVEHRGCTVEEALLLKTLQCLCFVIVRVEHRKQFSNHQQVLNSVRQIQQFELATLTAEGRVVSDQLADPTRVHVFHTREIEQNLILALRQPDS